MILFVLYCLFGVCVGLSQARMYPGPQDAVAWAVFWALGWPLLWLTEEKDPWA